jgi:hypothetical protein
MIVQGHTTLYITGKFTTTGTAFVYLAPGATLDCYVGGNISVSGGGVINAGGFANNLSVYGLNSCSSVNYSGSAAFIGTMVAPHADLSFSGGSGAFGSFTAGSISVNGTGGVHYDEGLAGPENYVVASWNEL